MFENGESSLFLINVREIAYIQSQLKYIELLTKNQQAAIALKFALAHLPENSTVVISAKNSTYIDHDVLELIRDFYSYGSKDKNIKVVLRDFKASFKMEGNINA